MADGHTLGHVQCLACWSRQQALPTEAQLRVLVQEDWLAETASFMPRAMTQEQAVAAELLTSALGRFVHAYGVDIAAPRIASLLMVLRHQAKRQKIMGRVAAARASINRRARVEWERCDYEAAQRIEAEPTPDYPGKANDDAWLSEGHPEGIQTQEAKG